MSDQWQDQLLSRPGAYARAPRWRCRHHGPSRDPQPLTQLDIFHFYVPVFVIAFLVSVLVTPLMRRIAVANGVIDRPSDPRKIHKVPVAYMGGVAVYLGMLAAIAFSYVATTFPGGWLDFHAAGVSPVPLSILAGMTIIAVIGLIDDVSPIDPRLKIGGQLLAAAMLAMDDVGVKVARGVLRRSGARRQSDADLGLHDPELDPAARDASATRPRLLGGHRDHRHLRSRACNASNLLDGLDGC